MFYACRYENDWYFGIANYVSIENNDVNVKFMYPKGPASKFFWPSKDDVCWIPAENLICEVILQRPVLLDNFMFLKKLFSRGYS